MRVRAIEKPAFIAAGLAVSTSQANQAADAAPLAARFFSPAFGETLAGRIDPDATIALHADWNEADETYRLMLAYEVAHGAIQPPGIDVLHVPAARYTVFTAVGPQPGASIGAWEEINAWRRRPGLIRTGAVSFEIHDARARSPSLEVDIYLPLVAG